MGYPKHNRARFRVACLAILLLAQLGSPAWAQRAARKSATPRAVKRLYRDGQAHYYAGRYREALEKFRKAVRLHPHPSIFLAVAQTYRKLDKLLGALSYYRRYKQAVDKSDFADIDEKIKEVEGELARRAEKRRRERQATITFKGMPPGAQLSVDRSAVPTPAEGGTLLLEPGVHQLTIRAAGHRPWRRRLDLKAKEKREVAIELVAVPSSSSPARSWLIAGIVSSAAVLALEATALAFTAAANNEFNDTDTYDRYKATAIAGHVLAVLAAGAAAVSWTFYFKRRRERTEASTSVQIVPSPGGVVIMGRF